VKTLHFPHDPVYCLFAYITSGGISVLVHSSISNAEAASAIERMRQALEEIDAAAVLAVSDAHGELIALLRMDGAPLPSIAVVQAKAFTAARQRIRTRQLALDAKAGGWSLSYYGDPRYIGWAGGLPVLIEGKVAGAVAVSGLSEDDDERIAQLGVDAVIAMQAAARKRSTVK
jgi:glc operon protein GlcG